MCNASDVKVFSPFFFNVLAWEGTCAQGFLGFVGRSAARDGQDESCLVWGGCAGGDSEASVPAAVDALRWILKVYLHALVYISSISTHDNRPAWVTSSHACYIKTLLPLFVDPLEWEAIGNLIWLLCVLCALRHDDKRLSRSWSSHGGDVVTLFPPFHDPFFR